MPIYRGHAPGHVRETFCAAVDAFHKWRSYGGAQPTVEFEINYEARKISLFDACGLAWNCTEMLPGGYANVLGDLGFKRQTYAAAARPMRKYLTNQ